MDELTKVINEALAMVEQAAKKYNESGENEILTVGLQCTCIKGYEDKEADVLLSEIQPGMKQTRTKYFEDCRTDFYEMKHNGVCFNCNETVLVRENEQVDL